jgi:hypothetical protein
MSKNILMIDDIILKQRSAIHTNIDAKLIYPEIKVAQDLYIHRLLGTALFNKILEDIDAKVICGHYKELLDDYIIDCLVWYTISSLPDGLSFQFWNKGVLRKGGEFTDQPSMSDLIDLSNKYKNRAESYADRLVKYLCQNSNKFPEYLNAGSGMDTIHPEDDSFSMPIYI